MPFALPQSPLLSLNLSDSQESALSLISSSLTAKVAYDVQTAPTGYEAPPQLMLHPDAGDVGGAADWRGPLREMASRLANYISGFAGGTSATRSTWDPLVRALVGFAIAAGTEAPDTLRDRLATMGLPAGVSLYASEPKTVQLQLDNLAAMIPSAVDSSGSLDPSAYAAAAASVIGAGMGVSGTVGTTPEGNVSLPVEPVTEDPSEHVVIPAGDGGAGVFPGDTVTEHPDGYIATDVTVGPAPAPWWVWAVGGACALAVGAAVVSYARK